MSGIEWSEDRAPGHDASRREDGPSADRPSIIIRRSAAKKAGNEAFGCIGAIAFLAAGLAFAGQVSSGPFAGGAVIAIIGFGFFGLFMALATVASLGRGGDSRLIEVTPAGLWLPGMGFLPWSEIEDVRLEEVRGIANSDSGATRGYRQLGVQPRDRSLKPDLATRLTWLFFRGFTQFLRRQEPQIRLGGRDLAPFMLSEMEATPAQFDVALAVVRRYVEVEDAAARRPRLRAPALWPARGATDGAGATIDLVAIDAHLAPGAAPPAAGAESLVPAVTSADPAATFVARRVPVRVLVWTVVAIVGPIGFIVATVMSSPGGLAGVPLSFLGFGALFSGVVVLFAVIPIVPVVRQIRRARPGTTVLRLGPDGAWLPGMGLVAWDRVAIVRTERAGSVRSDAGAMVERWRLVVVPMAGSGLGQPFGVTSDLLDAPFDDVLDLVRYYHPVEDR